MTNDRSAALASAVAARGGPILAAVEWHETLGSTSDRLKQLAREGAPEWTAVLADRQTGGRGREGRVWQSPPGGLYLSVLLKPKASSASLLPLAAGVAVASALSGLGVSCELKWPNDVLAGGRKLAGILAESSAGGQGLEWVVLGIGVNVALDPQLLPGELRESVASVRGAGASASPDAVAAAVLADLGLWYDACLETPRSVVDAWRARAAPWWGALVEVRSGGTALRGRLLAVDDAGALVIELPDGERRQFVSGEVERLRQAASS